MLQGASDPFFQTPEIFFGNLDDEEEETSIRLDLNLVFDRHELDLPLPPTGLLFHWFEISN